MLYQVPQATMMTNEPARSSTTKRVSLVEPNKESTVTRSEPPETRDKPIILYHIEEKKKGRTITVESACLDIDKLILSSLAGKNPRAAAFAKPVLFSTKYFEFLNQCLIYTRYMEFIRHYIREKLAIAYDRSTKPATDTPSALQHLISELNRTELQSLDQISLQEVHDQVLESFHEFSETYCFFILTFKKRHSQSRDRFLFEVIYSVTLEIVVQILAAYNVPFLIVHELERVFKTSIFQSQIHSLFKDPLQLLMFKYLKGLENPVITKKPGEDEDMWFNFKERLQQASDLVPQQQAWLTEEDNTPRKSVIRFSTINQPKSKPNPSESRPPTHQSTHSTKTKSRDSSARPSVQRASVGRNPSTRMSTPSAKSIAYQPSSLDTEKLDIVTQLQQIPKPYDALM
jgi:hypothetical protein